MSSNFFSFIIACMVTMVSTSLPAANRQEQSGTDKVLCVICFSAEASALGGMSIDNRVMECDGSANPLVIHASFEDLIASGSKNGHYAHVVCLSMWLQTKVSCPTCRKVFSIRERTLLGVSTKPAEQTCFGDVEESYEEAFMNSIALGDEARVRYLLQQGMRAGITDALGRTPLHIAAGAGFAGIVNLLLGYEGGRADINSQDRFFKATPLLRAVENTQHPFIIQELILAGALPNIPGVFNNTALHKAVLGGNEVVVKMLLDAGADVNARNDYGSTPLHNAANHGDLEIIRLLLNYRARKDILNARQRTPHAVAIARGYSGAAALLA